MAYEVLVYQSASGRAPFGEWVRALDAKSRARILQRIDRVADGNLGDHKALGEGVFELRLFFGPGYRVYFGRDGETVILLLCGGDKGTQSRDVGRAKGYWNTYLTERSNG